MLYTSGSTGKPKGCRLLIAPRWVLLTGAQCSANRQPRIASLPIHPCFDLDLGYLCADQTWSQRRLDCRGCGKDPVRLAALIAEREITNWYSTPSILSLLTQYGKMAQHDYRALRTVLFAGEVFPIKHLCALKALLPHPRYFNLYGPTETNVCTYYEVPAQIPAARTQPFPIGKACSHYQIIVVDEADQVVAAGQEGELCASGPGVMAGYWNLPERTARAFLTDASGQQWYRTGDIVVQEPDGNYTYIGRRDRMVKSVAIALIGRDRSGALSTRDGAGGGRRRHTQPGSEVQIRAFLSCHAEAKRPSLIELKRFVPRSYQPIWRLTFLPFWMCYPKHPLTRLIINP
ncbi:MAG: AMP-binding protein [Caldilineaceae bacterium]